MSLNQLARGRGAHLLAGVTDSDYQGGPGFLLQNEGSKDSGIRAGGQGVGVCVWGCFLVIPCPVVKVNEKTITTKKAKMTEGSDPAGMKVWVTPPAKEPRAAEVLADGGEVWNG